MRYPTTPHHLCCLVSVAIVHLPLSRRAYTAEAVLLAPVLPFTSYHLYIFIIFVRSCPVLLIVYLLPFSLRTRLAYIQFTYYSRSQNMYHIYLRAV